MTTLATIDFRKIASDYRLSTMSRFPWKIGEKIPRKFLEIQKFRSKNQKIGISWENPGFFVSWAGCFAAWAAVNHWE